MVDVAMIKRMGEAVKIDSLYFTHAEATREVTHPPKDVAFEGSYHAQGRLTSALTFEATVGFVLNVLGLDSHKIAVFSCTVVLKYRVDAESKNLLTDTAVDEFAQLNGVYHAYPYVREFVQTSCGRLSLPQIIMPPMPARDLFDNLNRQSLTLVPSSPKPRAVAVE